MDLLLNEVLSLEVPCDRAAPGAVRDALLRAGAAEGQLSDDALLVTSELVTNAVIHSGGLPRHLLGVTVRAGPGGTLISVRDPGLSGRSARMRHKADGAGGGRGLRIVEQLAVRWGSERRDGYWVWAELSSEAQDRVLRTTL